MNREIINGEIEHKEGLNGKNKSLKKTIKCALTGGSSQCLCMGSGRRMVVCHDTSRPKS